MTTAAVLTLIAAWALALHAAITRHPTAAFATTVASMTTGTLALIALLVTR